jgi:hypothetical protein
VFKKFDVKKNTIHVISLSCNLVPPKNYGGIELVIANLCQGLAGQGAKVICYSPGEFNIVGVKYVKTVTSPTTAIKDGGLANSKAHLECILKNLKKETKIGDAVIFNHPQQFRYLKKRLRWQLLTRLNCFEVAHTIDAGLYKNMIYPTKALITSVQNPGFVIHHGINLILLKNKLVEALTFFTQGVLIKIKG